MGESYEQLWAKLEARVHDSDGGLSPERRRQAWSPANAPEGAEELVRLLQGPAAQIADHHIAALIDGGWTEDQVFEFLTSGAVHAGRRTLDAGLAALEDA